MRAISTSSFSFCNLNYGVLRTIIAWGKIMCLALQCLAPRQHLHLSSCNPLVINKHTSLSSRADTSNALEYLFFPS